MTVQSILAAVIILGLLIAFHEFGHFIIAKLMRVGVKTFSIGFGPKLLAFKRGQTEYKFSAILLGGFVQLVGETRDGEIPEGFTEDDSFMLKPAWKRVLVVAAGPVFNFVLAWLLLWVVIASYGQDMQLAHVGVVAKDSPALAAGMEKGDEIQAINATPIKYWDQLTSVIEESDGKTLEFTVLRNGAQKTIPIKPMMSTKKNLFGEDIKRFLIGIGPANHVENVRYGFFESASIGMERTWFFIKLTGQSLVKIVENVVPLDTVGGPIMIFQVLSDQVQSGLRNVMLLTAVLSINLGLLNLLPIPVLDGGHIMFYTYETIFRRPVNQRVQEITTRMGLAFLIMLMLLATFNDIARMFK